ncbi:hypothetical protein BL180_00027825, partial [Klebsiella pneumoniae]
SAQIREILISESAWEEMTCLFAPSLSHKDPEQQAVAQTITRSWCSPCDVIPKGERPRRSGSFRAAFITLTVSNNL